MKISEVPQDGAFLIEGKVRDVCYAVDENGNYTQALSKGWEPKNEAMRLAWEVVYEKVAEIREQVMAGKLSPIAFYMELNLMDELILSDYVDLSKRKVRKHLEMKYFRDLSADVLQRYATAFNLTVEQLQDIQRIKDIQLQK